MAGCTQKVKTIEEAKDLCIKKFNVIQSEELKGEKANSSDCINKLLEYCEECSKARKDADVICSTTPYEGPCYEAQANVEIVCTEGWNDVKTLCK